MKDPQAVKRSPEEGEALIERIEHDAWSADDRRVVVQGLRRHFWLLLALQEAKRSLKRLRTLLGGEKAHTRLVPSSQAVSGAGGTDGRAGGDASSGVAQGKVEGQQRPSGGHRPGQGRLRAAAYEEAERVECRHEEWRVGEVCPVGGQGRLDA